MQDKQRWFLHKNPDHFHLFQHASLHEQDRFQDCRKDWSLNRVIFDTIVKNKIKKSVEM